MEVKPGYKQTEVGVIPEVWNAFPLGEIGGVRMCKRVFKHQTRAVGDVPFYKIGTFGSEPDAFISQELFDEYKRIHSFPRIGDVLISAAGTIGRTVVYDGAPAYFQDSNIVWIENDQTKATNDFLHFYYHVTEWSVSHGGTVARLYNDNLKSKIYVATPPLPEQRAIAEVLSDVDLLLGGLERLIAKKRNLKQAAMQQLLTGQTRLSGFEGKWNQARLGDTAILKARIGWQGLTTAEYRTCGEFSLVTGTEICDGNVDWNSCSYVSQDRYDQDRHIQLLTGDVLVTKDGTIGKTAIVRQLPRPATLNSGVFVIRPIKDAFDPGFFFRVLASARFIYFLNQLAAGSTINHLYQKDFVHFQFDVPPTIAEQRAIAAIFDDMDEEINILKARLAKTRDIKQGMMQQLLTGKVRLT